MTIEHGLFALACSLIGSAILYAWKGGSLTRGLEKALEHQGELLKELREKVHALDEIPTLKVQIGTLERHMSQFPRMLAELEAVKAAQKFSGERARLLMRQSRPDNGDDS